MRDLGGSPLRTYIRYASGSWAWSRDDVDVGRLRVASVYPSGVDFVHADHLGSPRKVTDASRRALLANEMAQSLASSSQYRQVSALEAQALANRGVLVIAAWPNPDPRASGHVATVRPQGVAGDVVLSGGSYPLPLINNIGNFNGVSSLSRAFPRNEIRLGNVRFYAAVGQW